jgi:hypothetical protein
VTRLLNDIVTADEKSVNFANHNRLSPRQTPFRTSRKYFRNEKRMTAALHCEILERVCERLSHPSDYYVLLNKKGDLVLYKKYVLLNKKPFLVLIHVILFSVKCLEI